MAADPKMPDRPESVYGSLLTESRNRTLARVVIVRARPLGEQIADELRKEIVTGKITEDSTLTEESVAARFEVSRGPVRDALKRLATQHLIARTGRSYTVIGLGQDDIDDLYEIRRALERIAWSAAAESAAESMPESAVAALSEPLERMRQAADAADVPAFTVADVDFHTAIIDWTGRKRLIAMWHQIEPSIRMTLQVTNQLDEDATEVYDRHVDLVRAVQAGDAAALAGLLDAHLGNSRRKISKD